MNIQKVKLSDLVPADYNPREISDAALNGLSASIERFGLVEPIVWNKRTSCIVGGHQRLKVLLARGDKETSVIVVDLSEIEEKALNVTLNNPKIQGMFTDDLQTILDEIKVELPDIYAGVKLDKLELEDVDAMLQWKGMPEYESNDLTAYKQVIVSFANEDDMEAFSKLVEQLITMKTKSIWFPPTEIDKNADLRYVDTKE